MASTLFRHYKCYEPSKSIQQNWKLKSKDTKSRSLGELALLLMLIVWSLLHLGWTSKIWTMKRKMILASSTLQNKREKKKPLFFYTALKMVMSVIWRMPFKGSQVLKEKKISRPPPRRDLPWVRQGNLQIARDTRCTTRSAVRFFAW